MPIRTDIWTVGDNPVRLRESSLAKEELLERMIVGAPRMLSEEWLLIGQQEPTGLGGRIDLLALAPDGSLVLIELKRDRTPREVVAQALDYAGWVSKLESEDILGIYGRFAPGRNLSDDFRQRFGQELDEDTLNESHQIIVVAATLDNSSERIITYLNERGIPINVLCFQVFTYGTDQLLTRSWLLDPVETQVSAAATPKGANNEPWNGEFYCSFGPAESRPWEDAVRYSFISGGGDPWFSRTLQLLNPGDRIWVNVPGSGYVGVARAAGRMQAASTFKVSTAEGDVPVLDILNGAAYHQEFVNDPERGEYFVPVHWLQTVPLEKGVREVGLFGNQNTICRPRKPKWRYTVERLKERFQHYDKDQLEHSDRAAS